VPKIRAITHDDAPTMVVADGGSASASADAVEIRMFFTGDEGDELVLSEVHKPPPAGAPAPHAHDVDEIMYVLEGELILGNRHYGPGSAILVPADTLYSFAYGETGVRYLNFRARRGQRVTKDEFMARRHARIGAHA
jgi:hypothetical protein